MSSSSSAAAPPALAAAAAALPASEIAAAAAAEALTTAVAISISRIRLLTDCCDVHEPCESAAAGTSVSSFASSISICESAAAGTRGQHDEYDEPNN